jgi:hypothetical protein
VKIIFSLILLLSFSVYADDVSLYKFYANDGSYMAYIKKNDPCIYAGYIKENDIRKYCEMGSSNINLQKNSPSVYVSRFSLFGPYLDIIVAAPWNEQECEIYLPKNRLTCESTGK